MTRRRAVAVKRQRSDKEYRPALRPPTISTPLTYGFEVIDNYCGVKYLAFGSIVVLTPTSSRAYAGQKGVSPPGVL